MAQITGITILVRLLGARVVRKAKRDREILAAFEAGRSVEDLSEIHGLTCERITKILTAERHKRSLSPEPFYRAIRQT